MYANDSSLHMLLDKERALESCDGITVWAKHSYHTTQYSGFDSHPKFVYEG